MILHIDNYQSITDLQEKFNECFPALKIEFYIKPHRYKECSCTDDLLSSQHKIGDFRKTHEQGNLDIRSWYTTGRVERDFKQKFGLNVQIFRNENGTWIQTSASDNYTLKEQSDMADHASHSIFPLHKKQLEEYDEL